MWQGESNKRGEAEGNEFQASEKIENGIGNPSPHWSSVSPEKQVTPRTEGINIGTE